MIIKNAYVMLDDFRFEKKDIKFDEKIQSIEKNTEYDDEELIDLSGFYVIPGLVDIHTHAAVGVDAMDEHVDFDKWQNFLLSNGVTTFFPSTVAATKGEIRRAVSKLALADGINLEGPFLSYIKKGAHDEAKITAVDIDLLSEIKDKVKITTIAPEMWDNLDKIEDITRLGIKVSLGHSTADYDTAKEAFRRGATHVTHLFNAMSPLDHRQPGLIGAALEDENIFCEVISDGFHLHPSVVHLIYSSIGSDRMILISDSMRATGMPDGEYTLGGLAITVINGQARLKDGTIAGSTLTLYDMLKNAIDFGIPIEDAVKMATMTPARAVGLDKVIGSIKPGKDADLVVIDKNFNIIKVFYKGRIFR